MLYVRQYSVLNSVRKGYLHLYVVHMKKVTSLYLGCMFGNSNNFSRPVKEVSTFCSQDSFRYDLRLD